MRRVFPALCLLALLVPARSWAFGLESYDCETFTARLQHAGDALSSIISATATAVDGQSVLDVGVDNGSFAMSAIGGGIRFLGAYVALYVSPMEALNAVLVPTFCHRIV